MENHRRHKSEGNEKKPEKRDDPPLPRPPETEPEPLKPPETEPETPTPIWEPEPKQPTIVNR